MITEFAIPRGSDAPVPSGITSGPDGALWFTEYAAHKIGRVTTDGTFSDYTLPAVTAPDSIAAGSDGALWFTTTSNSIGRVTPAGAVHIFDLDSSITTYSITAGPDGALWFTTGGSVSRIATDGTVTRFPITRVGGQFLNAIAAGPDGALWFTDVVNNEISRMTTGGAVTEFVIPTANSSPEAITPGPDGALWFTEQATDKIGRISTSGIITEFGIPPDSNGFTGPHGITTGPDGALWFTESSGFENQIGRISTGGTVMKFGVANRSDRSSTGIATGSDGALWFSTTTANGIVNAIGRYAPAGVPPVSPPPPPVSPPPSVPPTGSSPTISAVADVETRAGTAAGPLSFTVGDAVTPAGSLTVTAASSNPAVVPVANIALGGTGADRTVTVTPAAGQTGRVPITLTVTDAAGQTATDTFAVTVVALPQGPPASQFAAGSDNGTVATTLLYNANGSPIASFTPFGNNFQGGARVAAADFNGDGVADVAAGSGPGSAALVAIVNGKTGAVLAQINPFESAFTGGVYVAAGDLNGDGVPDLVVTPDQGGGPVVVVYDGAALAKGQVNQLARFYGIADPNFRGGARAAVGDVNGDGVGDLVVAAGFGGGPRVAVFDGKTVMSGDPQRLFNDFYAFEQTLRNGVFIAAGDLTGSGKADIVAGGGPGGGPRVEVFSAADLLASDGATLTPLADFFGGDPNSRGGIRVAVKNLDGDTKADLVVGSGEGAGSHVTAYLGKAITPTGTPPATLDFDAFPGFTGGVFVG